MKCKSSKALTVKGEKQLPKSLTLTSACEQVKSAARLHNDKEFLHIIAEEDLIAKEFKMHKKCCREYTRICTKETSTLAGKLEHEVQLCLSQFQLGTSPPGNPRGLAQKHCAGGRDLTFESCPGAGNSTRAGILWKFKVYFVRVLVLSVINTGCPKNC